MPGEPLLSRGDELVQLEAGHVVVRDGATGAERWRTQAIVPPLNGIAATPHTLFVNASDHVAA
jgi:hypothetical protein